MKYIVILLFLIPHMLHAATIWVPNPIPRSYADFWIRLDNIDKWYIKNNGTLEYYYDGAFHIESIYKVEDKDEDIRRGN